MKCFLRIYQGWRQCVRTWWAWDASTYLLQTDAHVSNMANLDALLQWRNGQSNGEHNNLNNSTISKHVRVLFWTTFFICVDIFRKRAEHCSRVLLRKRELTELCGKLGEFRRKARWGRSGLQIKGWEELTELSPRNSTRSKKLTEFGVWSRPRNRIRPISNIGCFGCIFGVSWKASSDVIWTSPSVAAHRVLSIVRPPTLAGPAPEPNWNRKLEPSETFFQEPKPELELFKWDTETQRNPFPQNCRNPKTRTAQTVPCTNRNRTEPTSPCF